MHPISTPPISTPSISTPPSLRPALRPRLGFCLFALGSLLCACEPRENPYEYKAKSTPDLHNIDNTATKEELEEMRKAAGHPSQDEIAAENAAMFEKGAREYIKTRMPEYRALSKGLRADLDTIEAKAPKWKSEAAFDKFNGKYKDAVKAFTKTYDTLTGKGIEGGYTQADLSAAVRDLEQLNADIGPGIADNEAFPVALERIRERLDKVDESLDDIERDETLEVNPDYKPPKTKKKNKK